MAKRVLWLLCHLGTVSLAAQPSAPSPIAAQLRELPWAQLNFLHTTDTHGWHAGHLQEPSFSGDWGDYISFAHHLRARADAEGSDLLLIDTGDRIEGNGLFDASDPKGRYTYDIFKQQEIDLICSGNHELYKANSSNNEYYYTVPNYKGNYLASNLDILDPKTGKQQPLAPRYKKFKTKNQGIRILAFGFLFNFQGNANNTVIPTVEDTIKEDWFQEAIKDRDVDLIIVIGHAGIDSQEFELLYKTLREKQWDTPIAFFGGHTHIRNYVTFDAKAQAIESGRYMETIGFMSIDGLSTEKDKSNGVQGRAVASPTFGRRYIDNNLFSFYHHSRTNASTFATARGKNTSEMITKARHTLKLDEIRGCSPKDYFVNRAPYPHDHSIFSLLESSILPDRLGTAARVQKDGKKAIVITNTGAIRFDIFKGAYTHDTEYLVCPFTSGVRYIPDVPYAAARKILELINSEGPILDDIARQTGLGKWMLLPPEQISRRKEVRIEPQPVSDAALAASFNLGMGQEVLRGGQDKEPLFPGYTTEDDLGKDGDDTLHSQVAFYRVPNCIQATVGFDAKDPPETVDVAYNEFIQPWVILALRFLGYDAKEEDTKVYIQKTMTDIITEWVQDEWKVPKDGRCRS